MIHCCNFLENFLFIPSFSCAVWPQYYLSNKHKPSKVLIMFLFANDHWQTNIIHNINNSNFQVNRPNFCCYIVHYLTLMILMVYEKYFEDMIDKTVLKNVEHDPIKGLKEKPHLHTAG